MLHNKEGLIKKCIDNIAQRGLWEELIRYALMGFITAH